MGRRRTMVSDTEGGGESTVKENFWVDEPLAIKFAAAVKTLRTDKTKVFKATMLETVKVAEREHKEDYTVALREVIASREEKRKTAGVQEIPVIKAGKRKEQERKRA